MQDTSPPHFISLVGAARPAVLFGEQVASSEVFGKAAGGAGKRAGGPPAWAWIDDLSDRLEAARYAVGASDFPSAGVGAPHIRQRTFFGALRLADSDGAGRVSGAQPGIHRGQEGAGPWHGEPERSGADGRVANLSVVGRERGRASEARAEPGAQQRPDGLRAVGGMADGNGHGCGSIAGRGVHDTEHHVEPCGGDVRLAEYGAAGPWKSYSDWFGVCWHDECRNSDRGFCDCNARGAPDGWRWDIHDGWLADADSGQRQRVADGEGRQRDGAQTGRVESDGQPAAGRQLHDASPLHGFWRDADWLFCRDGKWRPVEPGTFPLAHGVSGRVGLLRGYGNAINPHAAAQFIQAFDTATRHFRLNPLSEKATDMEDIFG